MKENNWCLLTSGYGRSASHLLNLQKEGKLGHNKIALVIYDREPSGAAILACELGIETKQVKKVNYSTREDFEQVILNRCSESEVDFIFLLGFNYLLKYVLLNHYKGRILNVHPSLLPAFKGKRAIQQAIEAGVKITGITTHLIDDNLDEGKIICQEPIRIDDNMTFKEIDERYMKVAPTVLLETIHKLSSTKQINEQKGS